MSSRPSTPFEPKTTFKQLIDGKLVESLASYAVIDPSTGEPFAQAPDASREQLDAAVEHLVQLPG